MKSNNDKQGVITSSFISMKKNDTLQNINIKLYEQLFVGYEFEFDCAGDGENVRKRLCELFKVKTQGKQNGISTVNTVPMHRILNGVDINISYPIKHDNYIQRDRFVSDIYHDGSIEHEVVTIPISVYELDSIRKQVYDELVNGLNRIDFYFSGKGGLHNTFLVGYPNRSESRWDESVVRNISQFLRAFIVELRYLFCGVGCHTRSNEYCNYISKDNALGCRSRHGDMISMRNSRNGIWGIEFRFPDGKNNFDMIKLETLFLSAIIRQMAILSQYGQLSLSMKCVKFEARNYDSIARMSYKKIRDKMKSQKNLKFDTMFTLLEPSLDFYGIKKEIHHLYHTGKLRTKMIKNKENVDLMCDYINSKIKSNSDFKKKLRNIRQKYKVSNNQIKNMVGER